MEEKNRTESQIIKEIIDRYGCYIGILEADAYFPSYAFTIGLFEKFGHPEIVCFGLGTDQLKTLLNHATFLIEDGEKFKIGTRYSIFLNNADIKFGNVEKEFYAPYFGTAIRYYQNDNFPMMQLIWPDANKFFPDEEDFHNGLIFRQPLLDRNTDFMFYEKRNCIVFTSKDVYEGAPILYAYHNIDGDWQFHSRKKPRVKDAIIVCFEYIVKKDPSVNLLFDLPLGWCAFRRSMDDEWVYEAYEKEE